MIQQEVMTVEQLAKYLQLDKQTVYRKARWGISRRCVSVRLCGLKRCD